jgi:hypothetical protein
MPRRKDSFYQSLVDAGRWSKVLGVADFGPAGAVCRLPFQSIRPEFDDRWLSPGIVHACLAVPGYLRGIGLRTTQCTAFSDDVAGQHATKRGELSVGQRGLHALFDFADAGHGLPRRAYLSERR